MTDTLERGTISFFYRPRVQREEPTGLDDVQRLYVVLSPVEGDHPHRLIVIGRKRLPGPDEPPRRRRFWAVVDVVSDDPARIRDALAPYDYDTKTRGRRHQPGGRPAGEGVYRVVRHGTHTHLAYALELPPRRGPVQRALNIAPEASYVLAVKNPASPGLRPDEAELPPTQRGVFRGRRFAPAEPVDLLDHERVELVLVATSNDVEAELGIDLEAEAERRWTTDLFQDLRVDVTRSPIRPHPGPEGRPERDRRAGPRADDARRCRGRDDGQRAWARLRASWAAALSRIAWMRMKPAESDCWKPPSMSMLERSRS